MQAVQDADLLISSDFLFAAPLLAQKTGIPWVSYQLFSSRLFLGLRSPKAIGFREYTATTIFGTSAQSYCASTGAAEYRQMVATRSAVAARVGLTARKPSAL